jgi:hypothetical protein
MRNMTSAESDAYGFNAKEDLLAQLLAFNQDAATKIEKSEPRHRPRRAQELSRCKDVSDGELHQINQAMNDNDVIAQQQAALSQAMQNAQHWQIAYLVISLAMFIVGAWVLYMFYARLRDIADELLKLRIAYEMAEERKLRPPQTPRQPSGSSEDER